MVGRLRLLGAGLAVAALACSGGSGGDDPVSWSKEQLDADWEAYQRQRQLFVDGSFPLATPPVELDCPDDAECDWVLGYNIGEAFYAQGERTIVDLEVEGPVASLPIGEVLAIAGVEPAAYLVAQQPGQWMVLQSYDLPLGTTTRQRAIELREAQCSIQAVAAVVPLTDCDDPTISWLVDEQPGSWSVVDPAELSDGRVHRREPQPETLDRVGRELAAGSDAAHVRTGLGQAAPAGPYTTADEALAELRARWCVGAVESACRSGYRVESSGPGRVAYTEVVQRPTPGSESRLETFYARGSIELFDGAGWWFTESGPSAVHQNGSGQAGRADADQRFDGCCEVTSGQL